MSTATLTNAVVKAGMAPNVNNAVPEISEEAAARPGLGYVLAQLDDEQHHQIAEKTDRGDHEQNADADR